MIFPAVVALTEEVVTVKFADELLGATVTEFGTVAAGLALARVITAPPAGAGPVKLTVPVTFCPLATVEEFSPREFKLTCPDGAGL